MVRKLTAIAVSLVILGVIAHALDFNFEVTPDSKKCYQGESVEYRVKVNPNRCTDDVYFSVLDLPSSINPVFTKNPLKPGEETTLTLSVSSSTSPGTYRFRVKGKSGSTVKYKTVKIKVLSELADFEILIIPEEKECYPEEEVDYLVKVVEAGGTSSAFGMSNVDPECTELYVHLSVEGLPSGISGSLDDNTLKPGEETTLTLDVSPGVDPGTYNFRIKGKREGTTKYKTASIKVLEHLEDFAIVVMPTLKECIQGDTAEYQVQVNEPGSGATAHALGSPNPANGTGGVEVSLSVLDLPTGISASFEDNLLNPGEETVLTLSVSSDVAPGTYTFRVQGQSSNVTKEVTVKIKVLSTPEEFDIVVEPLENECNPGESVEYLVKVTESGSSALVFGSRSLGKADPKNGGFDVTLSVEELPSGVTGAFADNTLCVGEETTLTLDVSTSASPGTYEFHVKGESDDTSKTVTAIITVLEALPEFDIVVEPIEAECYQGESVEYQVKIAGSGSSSSLLNPRRIRLSKSVAGRPDPANGGPGVNLSVTDLPSGINGVFADDMLEIGEETTLTLDVATSASAGTYEFHVKGESGDTTKVVSVKIKVLVLPEEFDIVVEPAEKECYVGESAGYNVKVVGTRNFDVSLSLINLSSGFTSSFANDLLSPGEETTLTVNVPSDAVPDGYEFRVKGQSADTTKETSVKITVLALPEEFDIFVEPIEAECYQGESAEYQVKIIGSREFEVTLSVLDLPTHITATFADSSLKPGEETTLTLAVSPSSSPGTYDFRVQGQSADANKEISVKIKVLIAPEIFDIVITPSEKECYQGESAEYQVKIIGSGSDSSLFIRRKTKGSQTALIQPGVIDKANPASNSFDVALSVLDLPSGISASFEDDSLNTGEETTLTLTISEDVAAGTYTFRVKGQSADITKEVNAKIKVLSLPEDFELDVTPSEKECYKGEETDYQVKVIGSGEFDVTLSVSDLPSGISWSFEDNPLNPGEETTLALTISEDVAAGTYSFRVQGQSADAENEVTVKIKVLDKPENYSLEIDPVENECYQGESAEYTIRVNPEDEEFTDFEVNLSVVGLQSGISSTMGDSSLKPGEETVLTLSASDDVEPGTYTFKVKGVSSGTTRETETASLTVHAVDYFHIEVTPENNECYQGKKAKYLVMIPPGKEALTPGEDPNLDKIHLKIEGLPSSIEWELDEETLTIGGQTDLYLSPSENTDAKRYNFKVVGKSSHCSASCSASLLVKSLSSFDLEVNPETIKVERGVKAEYTVKINGVMSSSEKSFGKTSLSPLTEQLYELSTEGIPDHIKLKFEKRSIGLGESTALILEPTSSTLFQSYDFKVLATYRDKTVTRDATLVVLPPGGSDDPSDIPFGGISVKLKVSASLVTMGESLVYTLRVLNNNSMPVDVEVFDTFPHGFTYIAGRTTLDGAIYSDPETSGTLLKWHIDNIPPYEDATLAFQFIVGPDASVGENVNAAQVLSSLSGLAASDQVSTFVESTGFLLLGEVHVFVYEDINKNGVIDSSDKPFPGVTLLFEDGTEFVTNKKGVVEVRNVIPDTHVLSLPPWELPKGYEVVGDHSQYVRIHEGGRVNKSFLLSKPSLTVYFRKESKIDNEVREK